MIMILNCKLCLLESIYCVLGMCSGPVLWPCVEDLRSSQYVHLDLTHFIIIILCYFDKMAWLNFFWFNEINTYTDIDYNNLFVTYPVYDSLKSNVFSLQFVLCWRLLWLWGWSRGIVFSDGWSSGWWR